MNNLSIRKMNELSKKKKKGFTLVELIIVIAIIAILAAIALPKFGEIRENANVKTDISNAKAIQTAVATKSADGATGYAPGAANVSITAANLASIIDGGLPVPKSKEALAAAVAADRVFTAVVEPDGDVIVSAGGLQVLPQVAHADTNPYSKAS